MAATQVFATLEIFEIITGDIDIHELFVNQRVNRQWQFNIRGSEPLRSRMFMRSGPTTDNEKAVQLNPLINQVINLANAPTKIKNVDPRFKPGATWRNMLLLRPTSKGRSVYVHIWYNVNGQQNYEMLDKIDGSGFWRSITMEGLLARVEKLLTDKKIELKDIVKVKVTADVVGERKTVDLLDHAFKLRALEVAHENSTMDERDEQTGTAGQQVVGGQVHDIDEDDGWD